jgi:predicted O-methyltransferase YrrM
LLAPLGARAVERMLRDGLPPRLAPALRFLTGASAPAAAEETAVRIERLRAQIAERPDVYRFEHFDTALGPVRVAERTAETNGTLTSHRLATAFSVPKRWGVFLHLCAEAFDARGILEMGACVGISGAYLASIRTRPHLFTLEGSQSLAQVARESLATISDEAEVVVGPFEETLTMALDRLAANHQTLDVAFVDGHHEQAATLDYVARISAHLSPTALIILDDIYLYEGMWRAWQTLSSAGNVIAINVGRFGLLVHDGSETGRLYDLARYTGRWRVGRNRTDVIAEAGP